MAQLAKKLGWKRYKGLDSDARGGIATRKREVVALIKSGSGQVLGEARITDSLVVRLTDLGNNVDKHCIEDLSLIEYPKVHAWVLTDAKRYTEL